MVSYLSYLSRYSLEVRHRPDLRHGSHNLVNIIYNRGPAEKVAHELCGWFDIPVIDLVVENFQQANMFQLIFKFSNFKILYHPPTYTSALNVCIEHGLLV